jgi:hypothetical protein
MHPNNFLRRSASGLGCVKTWLATKAVFRLADLLPPLQRRMLDLGD